MLKLVSSTSKLGSLQHSNCSKPRRKHFTALGLTSRQSVELSNLSEKIAALVTIRPLQMDFLNQFVSNALALAQRNDFLKGRHANNSSRHDRESSGA